MGHTGKAKAERNPLQELVNKTYYVVLIYDRETRNIVYSLHSSCSNRRRLYLDATVANPLYRRAACNICSLGLQRCMSFMKLKNKR